jgi:hypothetical protein
MTLTFQILAPGNAQLSFSNLSVLENDGQGTALQATSQSANYTFQTGPSNTGGRYILGDLNHDGKVTLSDLSILIGNWKSTQNSESDLNHDGVVDIKDISTFLSKMEVTR